MSCHGMKNEKAPTLSHHKTIGEDRATFNSLKSMCNQYYSAIVTAIDHYYASVLEWATTDYFFALQEIK
jgi:hypothetical protein